jgi:tRNA(adenine34) deaminase
MARRNQKFSVAARDLRMMARCLELSREGAEQGEYPFGSVVARGDDIVGEGVNHTARDVDESRHAEIVAIANARRNVGARMLRKCTVYSTVEPCAMCSFVIRAAGMRRVVFSLHSPVMGGLSRWDILRHRSPCLRLRLVHGSTPEVVAGVLAEETLKEWSKWRPLIAHMIATLGIFAQSESNSPRDSAIEERLRGADRPAACSVQPNPPTRRSIIHRWLTRLKFFGEIE